MRRTVTPAIILAVCLSAHTGSAASAAELSEICKLTKCRAPGIIKLRTGKGEVELRQPGLPYVIDGQVIVLPGDEFDIEVDFAGDGKTASVRLPGGTPRPGHTIHLDFRQMDGQSGVLLSLRNGTDAIIKYDAYLRLPDGRSGRTSSCPVMAGLGAFEMWPDPISQLTLMNFRRQNESDGMKCE